MVILFSLSGDSAMQGQANEQQDGQQQAANQHGPPAAPQHVQVGPQQQ